MEQSNAALTSSNSAVMAHFSQMIVTMNAPQEQLKTLASEKINQARSKRKHYFWRCGTNFTRRSRICPSNKAGHQDEAYYKKGYLVVKRDVNEGYGRYLIKMKLVTLKLV